MAWAFESAVKVLNKHLKIMDEAGIKAVEALVLTTLLSEMSEETGEVTSVSTIAEISRTSGIGYDQVGRALLKLREKGLISRKQMSKTAGESAYTTILPAGFAALGLIAPGADENGGSREAMPRELVELLCGQTAAVVEAVERAWNNHLGLPSGILSEVRGGGHYSERIERFLAKREESSMAAMEVAIVEAQSLEEARAAGMDIVKTVDGDVIVNVKAFEEACPVGSVKWDWCKDVLNELYFKDRRLVTKENLRDRIAEAAYARISLPFVRDKAWNDGVRLLARQMQISWTKPRKIWDSWYAAADQAVALIHKDALFV